MTAVQMVEPILNLEVQEPLAKNRTSNASPQKYAG